MVNPEGSLMYHVYFSPKDEKPTLDQYEIKTLVIEGRGLFALLKLTPEAKTFLKLHPELAKVIDKW